LLLKLSPLMATVPPRIVTIAVGITGSWTQSRWLDTGKQDC
jgi:hypothetical protein